MNINFKVSEDSERRLVFFKQKFNVQSFNILARIAFAYSISKSRKFNSDLIKDSKGKTEFKDPIIFGNDTSDSKRNFYIALACQYYNISKNDGILSKYIKFHVDDGLELIERFFESNPNHSPFDFLIEIVDRGIETLEEYDDDFSSVYNSTRQFNKSYSDQALKIDIGFDQNDESIQLALNNIQVHNNCHMAIAGSTGTGKTQFALELLAQIVEKSKGSINFIYLDFKGLKQEDKNKMQGFFQQTQATLIDAPHQTFPINPLSFIDTINEINRKLGIAKFVDIIANYAKAGDNQKQLLKDAVRNAFINNKKNGHPTLSQIYNETLLLMKNEHNRVLGVLEGLSDYPVFADKDEDNFLNNNYYLSLSGDLPNDVRLTAIFLIINHIYNLFMNMEDTPVMNGIKSLRYVLLIDEAHVLFKDKKSQEILEKVLREIRSKGVAVILLSQGIAEFNQPSFDFSSMCEISFLLEIKDRNFKMVKKFMGFTDNETILAMRSFESIQKGKAISNIKEYKRGLLFNLKQWKDR
ncbi:MAG: helicase HerA-like domain-containing protein [Microscillaceae bacterium]|nr:helicase HerA-like domain-containing protein [Microscillaceae bacterium]